MGLCLKATSSFNCFHTPALGTPDRIRSRGRMTPADHLPLWMLYVTGFSGGAALTMIAMCVLWRGPVIQRLVLRSEPPIENLHILRYMLMPLAYAVTGLLVVAGGMIGFGIQPMPDFPAPLKEAIAFGVMAGAIVAALTCYSIDGRDVNRD